MPSIDRRRKDKRRAVESDSEGEGSDAGGQGGRNDEILTKVEPEYLNQPIDLKQGDAKLRGLVANLKTMQKQLAEAAQTLHSVCSETAELLSEEYRDEDYNEDKMLSVYRKDPSLSGLDVELRKVLDRHKEIEIRMNVISDIRGRIVQGHQITDLYKQYEQKLEQPLEAYRQKTERQRFLKSGQYKGHIELTWENLTGGQGVPNLKRFLPRSDADEDDSDEELEIGAERVTFACPITLAPYEDPYTSTVCPHSFSGEAIKEMIRQNRGSVQCPVAGCPKTLTLGTLEQDVGLARRTEAHQKRLKEGRTQATQAGGKTYETMDLDESDEE
ncbi:hypothetical protein JCM11641_007389 [Rhodosporidiobolus odoratus]